LYSSIVTGVVGRTVSHKSQFIVVATTCIIAVTGAIYRLTPTAPVSPTVDLVCVATGETFNIARKKLICIPMRNPRTGEATLLPCHQRNGVLYINRRYGPTLADLGARNRYVDPETLAVRTPP
jgi:hypothetical protein